MGSQGTDEFFHRVEAAAHCAGAPFFEIPSGPTGAGVLPEGIEGFLEKVGSDGFEIELEDVGEFGLLVVGEVGGALEEAITRSGEDRLAAFGLEPPGFLAAYFIDGFAEFFDDMEAVEDVEGGGQHAGDDVEIGLPHVGADDLDPGAAGGSEFVEEAFKCCSLAVDDNSEQTLGAAIDLIDESHVLMALAVGDFIDAKSGDIFQVAVFQAVIDDPPDGAADVIPGGVEACGGLLPAESSGPAGEKKAVDIAAGILAGGPWDSLDLYAAIRAANPAHGIGKEEGDIPDRDEFKEPGIAGSVISGPDLTAARTAWSAVGPGPEFGDDPSRLSLAGQGDAVIDEALETVDFGE